MGSTFFPDLAPRYGVDPKSGDEAWPSTSSEYEAKVRYWLEASFEEAKFEHAQNEEVQKVQKYVDYIIGKQWPAGRPTYKAAPVNNRIWKLLWELVGLLTDIRPTFEIKNKSDKKYDEHATILNKTMRSWWLDTDADMTLAFIIIYGILTTGYAKLQWNEDLQNGDGDLEIVPLGPNDVLTLKAKHHLQTAQAVIYQSVQPLGFFKKKFPRRAHLVEPDPAFSRYSPTPDRPGHLPGMIFDNLSAGMKRIVGNQTKSLNSTYPEALYREFWIQDWCVAPSTRVLTANLEWKEAGSLQIGEKLIGCDEEFKKSKKNRDRFLRCTEVESAERLLLPCLKITTDRGVVVCSTKHRWLARKNRGLYGWKYAEDLKTDSCIAFFCDPWETDQSNDAGYLAGLFDGEGTANRYNISFSQKPKGGNQFVLQNGIRLLKTRGYSLYLCSKKNGTVEVCINGGREENLRFLGTIRPSRLLAESSQVWEGKQLRNKGVKGAKVISVESVGVQEVVALKTTKKTFIAEGLVSHNSYNESNVPVTMGRKGTNWSYVVKPKERLYPRGRLLCMGGRTVLDDVPNPYWHGKYPFAMLRMNAVPWQIMGLSEMNTWVQLQDIINNILAGVLDMIKKATNPGFFAPKNAFTEGQWETMDWGMPGMKAAYSPVASQKPDFTSAPNLPSYVMQMMMLAAREMDNSVSGAVSAATQKKQVPSGESLDKIKEAQLTPVRLKGRNIEVFLRDLGSQQISNVFQFYDLKRRMYLLGNKGVTFEDFDWDPETMIPAGVPPEDHARRFKFMIEPDSLLNARRVEKAMVMLRLRLMGDMDRKHLYEVLDLGYDVETVEAELKREAKDGVPMHAGKGGKQPGGDMTKR